MTTLRNLLVVPQFSAAHAIIGASVTRYLDRDGYRQTLTSQANELTPRAQAAFASAVAVVQSQRAQDERISSVFGDLGPSVPDKTHTEPTKQTDKTTGSTYLVDKPVVDTWRPVVLLSLTLTKLDGSGQRTIATTSEQLDAQARASLLELWAALAE